MKMKFKGFYLMMMAALMLCLGFPAQAGGNGGNFVGDAFLIPHAGKAVFLVKNTPTGPALTLAKDGVMGTMITHNSLNLLDNDGNIRVMITILNDEPVMLFLDKAGKVSRTFSGP